MTIQPGKEKTHLAKVTTHLQSEKQQKSGELVLGVIWAWTCQYIDKFVLISHSHPVIGRAVDKGGGVLVCLVQI